METTWGITAMSVVSFLLHGYGVIEYSGVRNVKVTYVPAQTKDIDLMFV